MPAPLRYFGYVDESGQHSTGEYFVVCAVFVTDPDAARLDVARVEREAKRTARKWSRSSVRQKEAFLERIGAVLQHYGPLFYRSCGTGCDYGSWVISSTAQAALTRDPQAEYHIMVDGLEEPSGFKKALREAGVILKKLRGGRDESEPLLRLADFGAGFLGEYLRGKPNAVKHWERLKGHFHPI